MNRTRLVLRGSLTAMRGGIGAATMAGEEDHKADDGHKEKCYGGALAGKSGSLTAQM